MFELFTQKSVLDVINERRDKLKQRLNTYDPDELLATSDIELSQWFVSEYALAVPTLGEPEIEHHGDAPIDVRYHPGRDFRDPANTTVKGTFVIFAVPFEGDGNLFHVLPVSRSLAPPRAEIEDTELRIT